MPARRRSTALACFLAPFALAATAIATPPKAPLKPIPSEGAVPPIVDREETTTPAATKALERRYRRELRALRHRFLNSRRSDELRSEGLSRLTEFVDPVAWPFMVDELAHESTDVRAAVLDHLAARGDEGQAALARTAIIGPNPVWRSEALNHMTAPASDAVLGVLDEALRSPVHETANNAGIVANALNAVETIPLLIFAQATQDPVTGEGEGDVAWIGIQTQHSYVADLVPIVGNNSGAYIPVMGVLTEGVILRVMDAVAIIYRTQIHTALVNMTTHEMGESTAPMGYDMRAWWNWYNDEYIAHKNEELRRAELGLDAP